MLVSVGGTRTNGLWENKRLMWLQLGTPFSGHSQGTHHELGTQTNTAVAWLPCLFAIKAEAGEPYAKTDDMCQAVGNLYVVCHTPNLCHSYLTKSDMQLLLNY